MSEVLANQIRTESAIEIQMSMLRKLTYEELCEFMDAYCILENRRLDEILHKRR